MKVTLLLMLVAIAAPARAIDRDVAATAEAGATGDGAVVQVVVAGDGAPCVAGDGFSWVGDDGGSAGIAKTIVVEANADDDSGEPRTYRFKVLTNIAEAGDENRGWLGIALGDVATAEEGADTVTAPGVKVLNVVKDSPADKAGLTENDVILALNGVDVEGIGGFGRAIGELGPGGVANLTVLRDGQTLELSATLEAPRQGEIEWRFAPDVVFKEKMRTLPHVWRMSPQNGTFDLKLEGLSDLPGSIHALLENLGATTKLCFKDGKRSLSIVKNTDGDVLEISRDGDGPIHVKRYTEGQDDVSEAEYADETALEAADPDAYALFKQHQPTAILIEEDGQGAVDFDFNFGPDSDLFKKIHERIESQMNKAGVKMEQAHQALEAALSRIPNIEIDQSAGPHVFVHRFKATRSFKVQPDGQIEMTVRKGDSEVITVFKDEADLAARNPEAYDRYQEVMSTDLDE